MKFRIALVAATVLALPLVAKAQPITGLYIGAGGGVNIMQDEHASVSVGDTSGSGSLKTRVGPALDLTIGYGLGNGFRIELEGDYRANDFSGCSGGCTSVSGRERKYGWMGNLLYEFDDLSPFIQPYVGAGAGYQWVQDKNLSGVTSLGSGSTTGGTNARFAYQGIVGAAVPIAGVPGLSVTADYRFMGLVNDRSYTGVVGNPGVPATFKLSDDFNHTVLVGFRYAFGVAPAPVAPPAAAVPPSPITRSYLVFFDWDKATLTDRARQIVSEAAANSTKVQYTRLEVNGYTDTSGTPQYNQGLSVRRAQAVAAELVKDGVPKSAITIQGFGETHLLVPTGPGVREPQNRRVEIIIK